MTAGATQLSTEDQGVSILALEENFEIPTEYLIRMRSDDHSMYSVTDNGLENSCKQTITKQMRWQSI